MLSLTEDLLELCIARLSPRDIIACSSTCKKLNGIVTDSIPIQYKLHQHLYQDNEDSLPSGPDKATSISSKLSRLIKRQKACSEFRPTRSSFSLGEDQDIVCAYGNHIASALGYRDGEIVEPNQEGQYELFTLTILGSSRSGEKIETEKKSYKIPFIPIRGATLIDISKDVVIIQEQMDHYLHVKLHIFKVFNQGERLEYQGVGTMEVDFSWEEGSEPAYGPKISLGPQDTFYITTGRIARFYSWKDGLHRYTISLPISTSYPHFLHWVGHDTIVIRAMFPSIDLRQSNEDKAKPFSIPQTLSIYRTQDLTSAPTSDPTSPYMVLQMPSEMSDLPYHIRSKIPYSDDPDSLISPSRLIQTGSTREGILHLALCADTYSFTAIQMVTGVSMVLPPGKMKELIQAATSGQTTHVDSSVDWIRDSFKIPSHIPIIGTSRWRDYCFWALNPVLPASEDSHIHGTKLVTYNDRMKRRVGEEGGNIKLIVFDFNPRILRSHTPLGYVLGGVGQKMQFSDNGDDQEEPESISTSIISASTCPQVSSQKEYSAGTRYELQYTSKGDAVASVHYDGEMIILEHEDSTIDIWDFTNEDSN